MVAELFDATLQSDNNKKRKKERMVMQSNVQRVRGRNGKGRATGSDWGGKRSSVLQIPVPRRVLTAAACAKGSGCNKGYYPLQYIDWGVDVINHMAKPIC
jgi:hypothetical protein